MKLNVERAALLFTCVVLTVLTRTQTDNQVQTVHSSDPPFIGMGVQKIDTTASYDQLPSLKPRQKEAPEPVVVDGIAEIRSSAGIKMPTPSSNFSRSKIIEIGRPISADVQNLADYSENLEPIVIGEVIDARDEPIWSNYEAIEAIEIGEWLDADEQFPLTEPENLQLISFGEEMTPDQS